ncbi:MAG TPA: hypothetical protein VK452_04690 [Dissulfurispiraceae bacterium]|nr:hypothetical protein [Dissulfurispiraceae bacterium]
MVLSKRHRKEQPLKWVIEPLMDEPSYVERSMFGCLACYIHGRLALLLSSGEEPWNGLLIPTDHKFHQSILRDYRNVIQHPVLKKWLYLPEATEDFESDAQEIVEALRLNDERFGVEPGAKTQKKKKIN